MSTIYHSVSLSEVLLKLREKGFTFDFNQNKEDIILHPENYTIQHIVHYEGNSNPDDETNVYGIVSKYGLKGVFITGTASNSFDNNVDIISKLAIKKKNSSSL